MFSKPNSFMNLQGMFYVNTQRIFGVLRINRLTQHAFEAAPARGKLLISDVCRVLNREMLFLPNKLKLTLQRCRGTTRVRNFLLFIWKLNHFCQSWSEHACHFKRENVSPVHVCWFYSEECSSNCNTCT